MNDADAVLVDLLESSHEATARDIPVLVEVAARRLGLLGTRLYVSDVQQTVLIALPQPGGTEEDAELAIDSSMGGLAYRTEEIRQSRDGTTAWVPMRDGIPASRMRKTAACAK